VPRLRTHKRIGAGPLDRERHCASLAAFGDRLHRLRDTLAECEIMQSSAAIHECQLDRLTSSDGQFIRLEPQRVQACNSNRLLCTLRWCGPTSSGSDLR